MTEKFHKFPHTPHLLWLGGGIPRADKVMPSADVARFLEGEVIVEEKVDGANLGFSLGPNGRLRAQSRGSYLLSGRSHVQWDPLWPWLTARQEAIAEGLRGGLMLFGEWCYARHTIAYDGLPDWFLGFDILDTVKGFFWPVDQRNEWLIERSLCAVPEITRGRLQTNQIAGLLGPSKLAHASAEGIYLRRESIGMLESRAKVVSAEFKQQLEEHWTRRTMKPNRRAKIAATA